MECSPGSASSPLGQMWQKRKLGEVGVWVCALSHINWGVYLSLGVCGIECEREREAVYEQAHVPKCFSLV